MPIAAPLASETLISAYSFMFEITGTVFRMANVVGPCQTHGVAYDFIRRLRQTPEELLIYGDGTQSKPYVHVSDVLRAFRLVTARPNPGFDVFNLGTSDFITVREIADLVCARMGLANVRYRFTGGARGWKADVPLYRLDASKLRNLGWQPACNSRDAVGLAVDAMLQQC